MKTLLHSMLGLTAAAVVSACGGPAPGAAKVDVQSLQQVAQGVARGEDQVGVADLSHWLIEGRNDFVLIDIRKPEAFAAGHIRGAESVPLAELISDAKLSTLPAGRKLIVYAADSAEGVAAATLLRVAGRDALAITGGYAAWVRQILHPDIAAVPTVDEAPTAAEARAIACYFVGAQVASNSAPAYAPKPAPAFVPPVTSATPATPTSPRHREGC